MSTNANTEYKTVHDLLERVLYPKITSGELRASLTPPSTKGMVIEPISKKITYLENKTVITDIQVWIENQNYNVSLTVDVNFVGFV